MITFSGGGRSLTLQSALSRATGQLRSATERLSSGLRINHASDDAAGLAIASSLNTDTRVYTTGIRNLNDGISLLSLADNGLENLSNITIRIRELAQQAANGSVTFSQRKSLNSEANALVSEFNRIVATTSFNGRNLLDQSDTSLRLQAGYGVDGGIGLSIGEQLARATGTGQFGTRSAVAYTGNASQSRLVDVDHDGDLDLLFGENGSNGFGVKLNDGSGNFAAQVNYTGSGTATGFTVGDVNGDGNVDAIVAGVSGNAWVSLGNGDGTFGSLTNTGLNVGGLRPELADFNNDGKLDLVATGAASPSGLTIALGNGDGTFGAVQAFASSGTSLRQVVVVDFNHDGNLDVLGSTNTNAIDIFYGNGQGSFTKQSITTNDTTIGLSVSDFDGDGMYDLMVGYGATSTHGQVQTFHQNSDGTFSLSEQFGSAAAVQQITAGDVNGDGISDMVVTNTTTANVLLLIGNGDGTFSSSTLAGGGTSNNSAIGDINGDGAADIMVRSSSTSFDRYLGVARDVSTLQRVDLFDARNARGTLDLMQSTLDRVTKERASLGAASSRLETSLNVLWTSRQNSESAASQIMDADIAVESANAVKARILQNVAAAILGQANLQSNIIKDLLIRRK